MPLEGRPLSSASRGYLIVTQSYGKKDFLEENLYFCIQGIDSSLERETRCKLRPPDLN
jgi:hypothetical protein